MLFGFPFDIMSMLQMAEEDQLMPNSGPGPYRTAVHEVSHALAAYSHGAEVHKIDLVNYKDAATHLLLPELADEGQRAMIQLFVHVAGASAETELLGPVSGVVYGISDEFKAGNAAFLLRKATGWPGTTPQWVDMLGAIAQRWARHHSDLITYLAGKLTHEQWWSQSRATEMIISGSKAYGGPRPLFLGTDNAWQFAWKRELQGVCDDWQAAITARRR